MWWGSSCCPTSHNLISNGQTGRDPRWRRRRLVGGHLTQSLRPWRIGRPTSRMSSTVMVSQTLADQPAHGGAVVPEPSTKLMPGGCLLVDDGGACRRGCVKVTTSLSLPGTWRLLPGIATAMLLGVRTLLGWRRRWCCLCQGSPPGRPSHGDGELLKACRAGWVHLHDLHGHSLFAEQVGA